MTIPFGVYDPLTLMRFGRTRVFDTDIGWMYKPASIPFWEVDRTTKIMYGPEPFISAEDIKSPDFEFEKFVPKFAADQGFDSYCEPIFFDDAIQSALYQYPDIDDLGLWDCCVFYVYNGGFFTFPDGLPDAFRVPKESS